MTDSKPRVLVVDDDRAVRDSLRRSLEFNGYDVVLAADGAEALVTLGVQHPDVVVIDVMMPRLDGIETTRALRASGNDVPVLVLTARDAVGDRVEGLDAGADDYLTKPFALEELLARIRALLRRVVPDDGEEGEVLTFADLTMDVASRDVSRGGRPATTYRSSSSPRATRSATGSRASTPGPTTTSPSRSRSRSCWPGCARCCGARSRRRVRPTSC